LAATTTRRASPRPLQECMTAVCIPELFVSAPNRAIDEPRAVQPVACPKYGNHRCEGLPKLTTDSRRCPAQRNPVLQLCPRPPPSGRVAVECACRPAQVLRLVGIDDIEYATLEWVDWFNHRPLFEPIGTSHDEARGPPVPQRTLQATPPDSSNRASTNPGRAESESGHWRGGPSAVRGNCPAWRSGQEDDIHDPLSQEPGILGDHGVPTCERRCRHQDVLDPARSRPCNSQHPHAPREAPAALNRRIHRCDSKAPQEPQAYRSLSRRQRCRPHAQKLAPSIGRDQEGAPRGLDVSDEGVYRPISPDVDGHQDARIELDREGHTGVPTACAQPIDLRASLRPESSPIPLQVGEAIWIKPAAWSAGWHAGERVGRFAGRPPACNASVAVRSPRHQRSSCSARWQPGTSLPAPRGIASDGCRASSMCRGCRPVGLFGRRATIAAPGLTPRFPCVRRRWDETVHERTTSTDTMLMLTCPRITVRALSRWESPICCRLRRISGRRTSTSMSIINSPPSVPGSAPFSKVPHAQPRWRPARAPGGVPGSRRSIPQPCVSSPPVAGVWSPMTPPPRFQLGSRTTARPARRLCRLVPDSRRFQPLISLTGRWLVTHSGAT
jgi:hypothetical protein